MRRLWGFISTKTTVIIADMLAIIAEPKTYHRFSPNKHTSQNLKNSGFKKMQSYKVGGRRKADQKIIRWH
jgi:hypothetical protein